VTVLAPSTSILSRRLQLSKTLRPIPRVDTDSLVMHGVQYYNDIFEQTAESLPPY
jgi:hypothetical protein